VVHHKPFNLLTMSPATGCIMTFSTVILIGRPKSIFQFQP